MYAPNMIFLCSVHPARPVFGAARVAYPIRVDELEIELSRDGTWIFLT